MKDVRRQLSVVWILALVLLSPGCASDPGHQQGVKWVEEDQARLDALEKAGFPQRLGGR